MAPIKNLSIILIILASLISIQTLRAEEPTAQPLAATEPPTIAAIVTAADTKTAPDITGLYRLTKAERTLLSAKEDPLKGFYVFKGKLEIERLAANQFLVFEAQTVKNSGTMHYVSIFELIDGEFKKKLIHLENALVGDVEINYATDELVIKTTERDEFAETLTWQRIEAAKETKDKYLEKHIDQAKAHFEEYGLDQYKALRAK
ncbi:hypothetical protein [uncultured Thiothrix sp.]|uniref:hypothetical protein n=1 Tax=uncultured Thiothrix sp. TaxID=223185 RepID=UPI002610AE2D|nr:hypothetical protein [uncultured Thiothrix sp.]